VHKLPREHDGRQSKIRLPVALVRYVRLRALIPIRPFNDVPVPFTRPRDGNNL
jgi:hypothetical protein